MSVINDKSLSQQQQRKLNSMLLVQSATSRTPTRSRTRGVSSVAATPAQQVLSSDSRALAEQTLEEIHDFCGLSRHALQVVVREEGEGEETRRLKAVETGDAERRYR
eukprot:363808-Hanusia_phi.AAC.1